MWTYEDILSDVSSRLPQKRFEHTLGVIEESAFLAKIYGADESKAKLAALLHDCSRYIPIEQMRQLADKTLFPDKYPEDILGVELLHAIASEVVARQDYGVCDVDVLKAIRYHTTGCDDMSDIMCIVYTADMIEPTRNYPGVDLLRSQKENGLYRIAYLCSEHTINYLYEKGQHIHRSSYDFYNFLKGKLNNE
ncbi:MAG: HD domain-containing protein [Clostridiales bacterium]|nr:HD domain-containing protein [Clostridiales bacterium]